MEDVKSSGRIIASNAAADLGIPLNQADSGLLRQYVERRIPLGDHRLITCFAQFLAVGWQWSYKAKDDFSVGLMVRGLMEQMAIDKGRSQFAWLLAAMPDPNTQLISMNKQRTGLVPYAKLGSCSMGRWQHSLPSRCRLSGGQAQESSCRRSRFDIQRGDGGRGLEAAKALAAEEDQERQRAEGRCRGCVVEVSQRSGAAADREVGRSPHPIAAAAPRVNSPRGNASHSIGLHHHDPSPVESSVDSPALDHIPQFAASDPPISFLSMVDLILHISEAVHVGLSDFIKSSMVPNSRAVHMPASGHDTMPCPIPSWSRWTGSSQLSPRRRRRRKFLALRANLLQRVIAVLNWETLGRPKVAPPEARVGQPFSDQQWDMVCRLERLIDHHLRADAISSDSLGRSSEKFSHVLRAAQELPSVREVDLHELVQDVAHGLDPYSSGHKNNAKDEGPQEFFDNPGCKVEPSTTAGVSSHNPKQTAKLASSSAKPVVAARIKWEHSLQFDPVPFLQDDIVRSAFLDPSSVRLPQEVWPSIPRERFTAANLSCCPLHRSGTAKGPSAFSILVMSTSMNA